MEARHRVFVEEDGFMEPQGGAIADLYDALSTTANLVAVVDTRISGGLRITVDSAAGMPADAYFDFRQAVPPDARIASCSMMCLERATRANHRLLVGMLRMCTYWASARDLTHLCGPVNPKVTPILEWVGFAPVSAPFVGPKGLPSVPMAMDLKKMSPSFMDFVRRQDVGLWMDSFERAFFEPGEPLVTEGEAGDEAFLVVEGGAAAIAHGSGPDGPHVATFGPGDVFGELALLTDRPRSTTVVATAATDVMVLDREQFQRQVATNPTLALALMRSIGNRFHDAVVGRSPSGPAA